MVEADTHASKKQLGTRITRIKAENADEEQLLFAGWLYPRYPRNPRLKQLSLLSSDLGLGVQQQPRLPPFL